MTITFFIPKPKTAEELKKKYRELAFIYHPDRAGGNLEKMKLVNLEYETLFEKLKNTHTYTGQESEETSGEFIDIIDRTIYFENVKIEIIGSFIWISGETKPYKEILKELKFRWSPNKRAWYLAPEWYNRRNRRSYTLDEIREMYETTKVKTRQRKKLG